MLVHFKCRYDQIWDYNAIAADLFGSSRYLVVAEKLSQNAHVHWQGETYMSPTDWKRAKSSLSAKHFQRLLDPHARPLKESDKPVDDNGFQYMLKEPKHVILAQNGFTSEEIDHLVFKSNEHREVVKNGLRDTLFKLQVSGSPEGVHLALRRAGTRYFSDEGRRPGPRYQKDILWIMHEHPAGCDEWKDYVADRI